MRVELEDFFTTSTTSRRLSLYCECIHDTVHTVHTGPMGLLQLVTQACEKYLQLISDGIKARLTPAALSSQRREKSDTSTSDAAFETILMT